MENISDLTKTDGVFLKDPSIRILQHLYGLNKYWKDTFQANLHALCNSFLF